MRHRLQLAHRAEFEHLEEERADRRELRVEREGEEPREGDVRRDDDPEEAEDRGERVGHVEEHDEEAKAPVECGPRAHREGEHRQDEDREDAGRVEDAAGGKDVLGVPRPAEPHDHVDAGSKGGGHHREGDEDETGKGRPEPRAREALSEERLDRARVPTLERVDIVRSNLRHCTHQLLRVVERRDVGRVEALQKVLVRGRRILDHRTPEEVIAGAEVRGDRPDAASTAGGHSVAAVAEARHAVEEEVVLDVELIGDRVHANVAVRHLAQHDVRVEHHAVLEIVHLEERGQDVVPPAAVARVTRVDNRKDHRLRWRRLRHDVRMEYRLDTKVEAAGLAEVGVEHLELIIRNTVDALLDPRATTVLPSVLQIGVKVCNDVMLGDAVNKRDLTTCGPELVVCVVIRHAARPAAGRQRAAMVLLRLRLPLIGSAACDVHRLALALGAGDDLDMVVAEPAALCRREEGGELVRLEGRRDLGERGAPQWILAVELLQAREEGAKVDRLALLHAVLEVDTE